MQLGPVQVQANSVPQQAMIDNLPPPYALVLSPFRGGLANVAILFYTGDLWINERSHVPDSPDGSPSQG
jgi:hypothetical protein